MGFTRQPHQETWRGVIRGQLRQCERRANSLLAYDKRHESKFEFLSILDRSLVEDFKNLMEALLGQVGSPLAPVEARTEATSPSPTSTASLPVAADPNMPVHP